MSDIDAIASQLIPTPTLGLYYTKKQVPLRIFYFQHLHNINHSYYIDAQDHPLPIVPLSPATVCLYESTISIFMPLLYPITYTLPTSVPALLYIFTGAFSHSPSKLLVLLHGSEKDYC